MRRGSSLIEALIALVLLQFGLLAVVAIAAVASRDVGLANRRTRAHSIATSRVELLRAPPCPPPSTGSTRWPGGLEETWVVEAVDSLRRRVAVVVEMQLSRGRRGRHTQTGWMLCAS